MGLDTEVLERLCLEFLHPFENWNSIFTQMFSENAMFPVHKWPWILNFINFSFLSPWPTFCHTGLCSSCDTTVSQYFFVINFRCFPPMWTGLMFVCGGVYCVLWCVVLFFFFSLKHEQNISRERLKWRRCTAARRSTVVTFHPVLQCQAFHLCF